MFLTECIENTVLFIPFIVFISIDALNTSIEIKTILAAAAKISILLSVDIEFLQLFLRLGTVQLSDIFYNVFGGF